jgi:hypothetical protein
MDFGGGSRCGCVEAHVRISAVFLPAACRENIKSRPTMSLATDRGVGKDQGCSWRDQRANVLQKGRIYRDAAGQIFQVRWSFADTGGGDPVPPATGINRRQSRIDISPGESGCLQPFDGRPANLDAVAIDVNFAIRCTYDDRNWALGSRFRSPYEAARWRCARLSRKEQTRTKGVAWSGLVIGDDDGRADPGNRVKLRREIHRKSDATRRRRIAWQITGMHRDTGPGESLHMRHLGAFVDTRLVSDLLLQNSEHTGRRLLARFSAAYGRAPDPNAVAIDVKNLVRQTHQNDHRPRRGDLRMPHIISCFERGSTWSNRSAFRVALGVQFRRVEQKADRGGDDGGGQEVATFH